MAQAVKVEAGAQAGDSGMEDFLLSNNPKFKALLQRSPTQYEKEDCIPLEQMMRKDSSAAKRKTLSKTRS